LERDALKLTIVYLRLWKYCDVVLQESAKQTSSKFLEVTPIDRGALEKELSSTAQSKLGWADNSAELRDEINDTLALGRKPDKSETDYAVLSSYRESFQRKALEYSGELRMVSGTHA
jgi:hypothetical protein